MKNKIYSVFLLTALISSCTFYLPGFNFKLFKNTPVEELADAVEGEDLEEIEEILKDKSINIDYQEPKFGNTLLMLAVANNKNNSVKKLLSLGANPKIKSQDDTDAMLTAANNSNNDFCNTEVLKELVKYGGDVNSEQHKIVGNENQNYHTTALIRAISSGKCFSFIKILVDNGADINKYLNYEDYRALAVALSRDRFDVAKYLLIEKGAHIPEYIYVRDRGGKNEEKLTITDLLNDKYFMVSYKDNAEKLKLRKEILEFLKAKGLK